VPFIEDYALIGDTHSAGLVSKSGSIDWLCLPRFDSGAVFAALLDDRTGGCWRISPHDDWRSSRRYRTDSMVLETSFETFAGTATVVDCLPLEERSDPRMPRHAFPHEVVVRVVRGIRGATRFRMVFEPRFDYGFVVPWFRRRPGAIEAVGGPDALVLRADVPLDMVESSVGADFTVEEGETKTFIAAYHPSHESPDKPIEPRHGAHLIEATDRYWKGWAARCRYEGRWRSEVVRSLLTLKALTYSPSGGIVAAATTSIPEAIGGQRNWDYRYCWLRDATYLLDVLLAQGYTQEAVEWRDWLLRAVAGDPEDMQIMYGVLGERRLIEYELHWLAGYEKSLPVRVGNAAVDQLQLDVYGELMDTFHSARRAGIETTDEAWDLECRIVEFVRRSWREPDEGIWEVRSGREHFVHSKVMAWVALDRAVKAVELAHMRGPVRAWRAERDAVRAEILSRGFDAGRGAFRRAYGTDELDASLLMMPLVGFLAVGDHRMKGTIDAIERELVVDGFVQRYRTESARDGLPPGEGAFLLCTFWLAQCRLLLGRRDEAEELFAGLVGLCNDVGLLSEQFDARLGRFVGNFPQAFSHTALVTTALALDAPEHALARGRSHPLGDRIA
jgi:GH15 family glucan-1,4-alpha-glucosidase